MPHHPKPFFRPSRDSWYVEINGRQRRLGKHPDRLPPPKKRNAGWDPPQEILEAYHREMARRGGPQTLPMTPGQGPPVVVVLDVFLDWLQKRVGEGRKGRRTYDGYRDYLPSFVRSIDPALTCEQLAPIHVYREVDSHPGWKTGKRGARVAVQRALNGAAKAGLLKSVGSRSPLAGLEKPPQGKREPSIPPAEFDPMLPRARNEAFKELCGVAYAVGCRPHETLTGEARHVDHKNACWVFPPEEAKGKKLFRVVYLSERALAITRRLMAEPPEGPLFRNSDGRPWNPYAVSLTQAQEPLTSFVRPGRLGPLPGSSEAFLNGEAFCSFLALTLALELTRRLEAAGVPMPRPEVRQAVRAVTEVEVRGAGRRYVLHPPPGPEAGRVLRALEIATPPVEEVPQEGAGR